jgi:hypothetical protein
MICLTVISACIVSGMEMLKAGEMRWSYDGSQLLGNLNISENEE